MADSRPITGVTAEDQASYGAPVVANVSWSIAPAGIAGLGMGARYLVYYAGSNGADVLFHFTQAYPDPSPYCQFFFGTDRAISAGGYQHTSFGITSLRNYAQAAYPPSIDALKFGIHRLHEAPDTVFAFDAAYTAATYANVPFYFGGQLVASGFTVGNTFVAGYIEDIRKPLQFLPESCPETWFVSKPRVARYPDVDFFFTQTYANTSPYAQFHFGDTNRPVSFYGTTMSEFGITNVRNYAQAVLPGGFDSFGHNVLRQRLGQETDNGRNVDIDFDLEITPPSALNVPFYFEGILNPSPYGFSRLEFGIPTVIEVLIYGIGWESSTPPPPPIVRFRYKPAVAPWEMQDAYGTQTDVDFFIRTRSFAGFDALAFPAVQHISTNPQYAVIAPAETSTTYGPETKVGPTEPTEVTGFDSLQICDTFLFDYRGSNVEGFISELMGDAAVAHLEQYVAPISVDDSVVYPALVYPNPRYIDAPAIFGTLYNEPITEYGIARVYGPPDAVIPEGIHRLRFGYIYINLGAHAFKPVGIDSLELPRQEISYRIRSYMPAGFQSDSFWMPSYPEVDNRGTALYPASFDSAVVPNGDIRDRTQYAQFIHKGPDTSQFGNISAWFRVRTLYAESVRYEFFSPPPFIQNNKLQLSGFESSVFSGVAQIKHFWWDLFPTSWNQSNVVRFGNATLENRDRAFFVPGDKQTEYGKPFVWTNNLVVQGYDGLSIDPPVIADRTKNLRYVGWTDSEVSLSEINPDPIPPRASNVYGVTITFDGMGFPNIFNNMLFAYSVYDPHFGMPKVQANSLYPKGWFSSVANMDQEPVLIFTRYIYPPSFYLGLDPNNPGAYGTPFLWPHRIYAPHPIYNFEYYTPEYSKWGTPDVANQYRTLYHYHSVYDTISTVFGEHSIDLLNRSVYPSSIYKFRYGWAELLGGSRVWEVRAGITHSLYGEASVAPPPEERSPYLYMSGIASEQHGNTRAELKNRALGFSGFDSFDENNTIGGAFYTPRYFDWNGSDFTEWGEGSEIDYENRTRTMQGWDSFTARASPNKQMRISKIPAGTTPVHALR